MSRYYSSILNVLSPSFTNTYSLAFDGVDDFLDTGAIDLGETNTISFWFKNNSANTGNAIIGDANDNVVYFQSSNLFYYPTGSITGRKLFSSTNIASAMSDTTNWHNIIFIRKAPTNGTNGYNDLACYLDGNLEGTFADVYTANINLIPVYIGKSGTGFPLYDGNIDEVSYYNNDQTANVSTISTSPVVDLTSLNPIVWLRNGDNGSYKSPQWLIPNNSNKDKISNYSFEFDGVDDYIDMGNPSELQITGALSISAWVKFTGNTAPIVSKYESGSAARPKSFGLEGDRSGSSHSPKFFIYNSGTIYETPTSVKVVDDGNWHHLLAVFNPSTYLRLYIDGNLEQENTTSIPATIDNDAADFVIGAIKSVGNPVTFFSGNIDEVAVWNSDQSANIASIYNSGVPTTITGAVAHWKMGEQATFSTNWTVPDAVGSSDGTSANMTIEDRVGDAPNSTSNALSYNMDEADRVEDVPS